MREILPSESAYQKRILLPLDSLVDVIFPQHRMRLGSKLCPRLQCLKLSYEATFSTGGPLALVSLRAIAGRSRGVSGPGIVRSASTQRRLGGILKRHWLPPLTTSCRL